MTIEYKDSKRIVDTSTFADSYWQLHTSKLVNMGSSLGNEGTGAWTQAVWHKADDTNSVTVYEKYNSSPDNGFFLAGTQGSAGYYWVDYGVLQINSGVSPTVGGWDHIVVTRSSGGAFTIYVNGVSRATGTSTSDIDLSSDFRFATHASGQSNIADFSLWQRELTASEVLTLYNTAKIDSISQTNLTHHYDFAQTGSTLTDQVGSINGTRTGTTGVLTRNVDNIKPTDVQDNSILVEKDTAKRFWFDAESSETLSQETESGTGELFNDVEIVAQKFTSGSSKIGKKVSSVAFYLKRNTSTIGSTNLQCFVGAGNQSSAVAYGTLPATSLTTSYAWYTFTPSVAGTERTLVADDRIMIRWADGSTISDAVRIASDQSGNNPLANETGQYSDDDGSSFTDRSFDYMYKIISTTPATWTKDRQVTSGSAMTAGGGTSSATTNAQTSSNYVWTNIASISTARLYTFGTGNASNFTIGGSQNVENSETWNGSSWATAISTDTQRRDTTATAGSYNDMIVAYGRNNAGTLLNSSSTFNGTTWSAGVTANTAREHPCGAGQSDSMLIAGGYDSSAPSTSVDSYNGTTFTTETVLPTASYGQNMGASASNSAHIAGGATAMSGTYDGTTWTNTTELSVSTTHYFAGGGGDRDEHLVMGGYISSGTNYDTTWLWNGTSWVSKNALTTAKRAGAGDCTAR